MLQNPILGNAAASVPPGHSITNDAGSVILAEAFRNAMLRKYPIFGKSVNFRKIFS